MGSEAEGTSLLARHGLQEVPHFSDPDRKLYESFGLRRASWSQVFGGTVWKRGVEAFAAGHSLGFPVGDPMQMPGVFLIHEGRMVRAFRHDTAADRPDYLSLAGTATG